MPTFAISRGDRPVRRQTLTRSIIKIGRATTSHVVLDDDPKVSRMHAVIEESDGELVVIDLGSGTFVNGQRVNKCKLRIGDRILVGDTTLTLEALGSIQPASDGDVRVPTPELVREIVGESFSPKDVFGVAAMVLQVDGVLREAWSNATELSLALFESYPRGDVLAPAIGAPARSFKVIDDAEKTEERRCSTCIIRPGFGPCGVCNGTGSPSSEVYARCFACGGEGFIDCGTCDGTTRVVACFVRYVNDKPVNLRRVIMPAIHASIRPFVEARIDSNAVWPRGYVFDPEPGLVGSAYRGASSVKSAEDFHGFYFGDVLGHGLDACTHATTGLARFDCRTFAVPILWTVTNDVHEAYFFDTYGDLQHVP